MALLLPNHNAVFLHVPKTGGLFITNYLKKIGIPHRMIGYRHSPADLIGHNHVDKFKFCFIRNPVDWYKSYWQMRYGETKGKGGHLGIGNDLGGPHPLFHPTWEIDPYCMSADLNEYGLKCADLNGFLTRMYRRFIGHGIYKVNFVGEFANFHTDLMDVFDYIGVKYNKEDLIKAPRYNPSKEIQKFDKNVSSKIRESESACYHSYNSNQIHTGWL